MSCRKEKKEEQYQPVSCICSRSVGCVTLHFILFYFIVETCLYGLAKKQWILPHYRTDICAVIVSVMLMFLLQYNSSALMNKITFYLEIFYTNKVNPSFIPILVTIDMPSFHCMDLYLNTQQIISYLENISKTFRLVLCRQHHHQK